jgi:hypothetical protein
MNIYDLVTQHCLSVGTVDTAQVQRLVGTLRSAGFADDLPDRELSVVRETLAELSQRRQLRTAKLAAPDQGRISPQQADRMTSVDGMDRFIEIEAYIEKGQCPRCHTPMAKVKLGSHLSGGKDFLVANYCKTCRTTLWTK